MKKIGIMAKPIEQGYSGSGSHLEKIVEHMMKINTSYEIVLIHYEDTKKDIFNKYPTLKIPKNPFFASYVLWRNQFDLIHYSPLTIKSPVYFPGVLKVATIHGGASFLLKDQYSFLHNFHANYIRPVLINKMKNIFTVSNSSKTLIEEYDKYPSDQIILTHNAVDQTIGYKENHLLFLQKEFCLDSPYILHISRYSERKNPWGILQAFSLVVKSRPKLKLVIGGKGWDNPDVNTFIIENDLLNSVIRLGFISDESLSHLYSGAKLFLFPSLFEGCGMPNLEAMACRCPVITSSSFAIPEIVGDGAIVVEDYRSSRALFYAIESVLENNDLRNHLQERGLNQIKKYSWDRSAQTILSTYEDLLSPV